MRKLLLFLLCIVCFEGRGQTTDKQLELFCGAELNYADVNFVRLYDVLLNLTPGTKWHLGDGWMVAGQLHVPVANYGYGERNNMIRLNMAVLSKQLHFAGSDQHFKFSAGLFGKSRMGADVKWMFPVNAWLLFLAQAGFTGRWVLGADFKGNHESEFGKEWKFTGLAGLKIYLNPWDTEFQLVGGRYLNEKFGTQLDVMRHFKHCTVGLYAQLHEKGDTRYSNQHESGGFKVVMMLPPYKKSNRKTIIRPASNFRLTYNAQSDGVSMKMYETDPEENEREYPINVNWGTGNMNK